MLETLRNKQIVKVEGAAPMMSLTDAVQVICPGATNASRWYTQRLNKFAHITDYVYSDTRFPGKAGRLWITLPTGLQNLAQECQNAKRLQVPEGLEERIAPFLNINGGDGKVMGKEPEPEPEPTEIAETKTEEQMDVTFETDPADAESDSESVPKLTPEKRLEFVQGFLNQVQAIIATDISERLTTIVRRLLGEHEKKTTAIKAVQDSLPDDIREDVDTIAAEIQNRTIAKYIQEATQMLNHVLTGLAASGE